MFNYHWDYDFPRNRKQSNFEYDDDDDGNEYDNNLQKYDRSFMRGTDRIFDMIIKPQLYKGSRDNSRLYEEGKLAGRIEALKEIVEIQKQKLNDIQEKEKMLHNYDKLIELKRTILGDYLMINVRIDLFDRMESVLYRMTNDSLLCVFRQLTSNTDLNNVCLVCKKFRFVVNKFYKLLYRGTNEFIDLMGVNVYRNVDTYYNRSLCSSTNTEHISKVMFSLSPDVTVLHKLLQLVDEQILSTQFTFKKCDNNFMIRYNYGPVTTMFSIGEVFKCDRIYLNEEYDVDLYVTYEDAKKFNLTTINPIIDGLFDNLLCYAIIIIKLKSQTSTPVSTPTSTSTNSTSTTTPPPPPPRIASTPTPNELTVPIDLTVYRRKRYKNK